MRAQFSVTFVGGACTVRAAEGTKRPKFCSESAFWFALKTYLNGELVPFMPGVFDLVKKVMSKDGHMVGGDSYPYYLRDRANRFCIHDNNYATRDLAKEFNERGEASLSLTVW